jgi:lambda repressor-like predicted transcriptional regulator
MAASLLLRIAVEAGFAEDAAGSILTHAGVRMRRTIDGTTSLEFATGPRWQSPRRLPAAPAGEALRAFARRHRLHHGELADVLGIDSGLVESALTARWLAWERADEVAIALRLHPHDLWPDWFGHAARRDPAAADVIRLRTRGVPA